MAVASASLIIPAALYSVLDKSKGSNSEDNILILSHGTSIILLIIYVMYLYFQLGSHAHLFKAASEQDGYEADEEAAGGADSHDQEPGLNPWAAGCVLLVITIGVSVCADYLVGSIDEIARTSHISKTFIGLILIPIVGNAAEHVTAVVVSMKDKMDLAINVAIGSSLQIALLVTPFLVILGWIIDQPMTLHFETFETVVFFLSVLVVNYLIQDGESNYLEGAMLLGTYVSPFLKHSQPKH
jgi:Ca2+:H+ antiporter